MARRPEPEQLRGAPVAAVAREVGVTPATLREVLSGAQPSWYGLRCRLAAHLGVPRAELFPDEALQRYDAGIDAGLALRAEVGLAPTTTDETTLERAAVAVDVHRPATAAAA